MLPGVEGLCHNSEIPHDPHRAKSDAPLPVGEEMDFKIIKLNEAEKRIGLSIKALAYDVEKHRLGDYQRQAAAATQNLEEVINVRRHGEG